MFKRMLGVLVLATVMILTACGSIKTIACEECGTENDIVNLYCSNCAEELVLTEEEMAKVDVERVDNRCDIILKFIEEDKYEAALELIKGVEESVETNDELKECKYQLALVTEDCKDKYKLFLSLGNYKDAEEKTKESYYDWAVYLSGSKIQEPTAYKMFAELSGYKDSQEKAEELLNKMDIEEVYELGIEAYKNRNFESAKFFFEKCENYEDAEQLAINIDLLEEAKGVYEVIDDDDSDYIFYNKYIVFDGTDLIVYDFTNDNNDREREFAVLLAGGEDSGIYFTTEERYPELPFYVKVYLEKKGENIILTEATYFDSFEYKKVNDYTAEELEERYNESKFSDNSDNSSNSKSEPNIGMTADEVRASTWGAPIKINKTTYSWGVKEQWVYFGDRYIYLEDGIVTAISE